MAKLNDPKRQRPQPWQLFKRMERRDLAELNLDPDLTYDEVKEVWTNGYFICTVYRDAVNHHYRLTIETADRADLTWDQLMWVKEQVGRGEKWALEVYPTEREKVAVGRALRHLWLVSGVPEMAWTETRETAALAADSEFAARARRIREQFSS